MSVELAWWNQGHNPRAVTMACSACFWLKGKGLHQAVAHPQIYNTICVIYWDDLSDDISNNDKYTS